MKHSISPTRAKVHKAVKDLVENLYIGSDCDDDYDGFATEDLRSQWEDAIRIVYPWVTVEWDTDEHDWKAGVVAITRLNGRVRIVAEPDSNGHVGSREGEAAIDAIVDNIFGLEKPSASPDDLSRGDRMMYVRSAIEHLRAARAQLKAAGSILAHRRVLLAINSAEGALRHADLRRTDARRRRQVSR